MHWPPSGHITRWPQRACSTSSDRSWNRPCSQCTTPGVLRQLRTQIDDIEDTLVHRTRKAARATDEAVHAHPYTAIGIAGLAGVLLGALLARR
jgi:hypothetical protein